ncbi:MAG: hypothetical protein OEQ28_15090 [Acidobacteriota bacterium]|nr:hypothetical protein [Acidobacteriota bacterium]
MSFFEILEDPGPDSWNGLGWARGSLMIWVLPPKKSPDLRKARAAVSAVSQKSKYAAPTIPDHW